MIPTHPPLAWQPIDTAPQDRRVLLYLPGGAGRVVCGRWDADEYSSKPRPYWTNDQAHLYGARPTRRSQPTHWMALPDAPAHDTMTMAADDTRDALTAALERIQQLDQVLWEHIRTYRVDDQHPDPDAEAHRLMQHELHVHPKMTTENDQT